MIKKIASIKNIAVFSDFTWDKSVKDRDGVIQGFKQVNIMYGRNYSGKTTLSRIMRAFETGYLSDKYGTPTFRLETDEATYTETDYFDKPFLIRVFNEDFIRDNLRFVIDQSESIAPFAILGENNEKIEKQVEQIQKLLGSNEIGCETGLYQKREVARKKYQEAHKEFLNTDSELAKLKNTKATGREVGIKYHPERFGNQNYNIRNLETDIEVVLSKEYIRPTNEQVAIYENAIIESTMSAPKELRKTKLSIEQISIQVKEICERKVGQSQKIQELLSDIALQEWVHQGVEQNKGREYCAFCGNRITDSRWNELFSHFDEESEHLRIDIENCFNVLDKEENLVKDGLAAKKEEFYVSFAPEIDALIEQYYAFSNEYIEALHKLRELLVSRKNSIHAPVMYSFVVPDTLEYDKLISLYSNLRAKNIQYAASIDSSKKEAQKQMRLAEVYDFVKTIGYENYITTISTLAEKSAKAQENLQFVEKEIIEKLETIDSLKRQQNDEEKGAIRVNELLQMYFGHKYLSIVSKTTGEGKKIYFEVVRNGEKAFHLSEGEKSLIAFCYYIAKLKDIDTDGKKPIIWIDDPISSLDENHIYYVYSLITQEILNEDNYEQLFITTHNLLFLKYLRVLSINKHNRSESGNSRGNFLIERKGENSTIVVMPSYLKNHGTEFNRWFENIYYCATTDEVTDDNIYLFESFGNNVRKFFETYLYYRYPDKKDFNEHLSRFFDSENIPPILVRKLSDENSHAQGDLESYLVPFDEPEINDAAKQILKRLEEIDKEQYDALISNIS